MSSSCPAREVNRHGCERVRPPGGILVEGVGKSAGTKAIKGRDTEGGRVDGVGGCPAGRTIRPADELGRPRIRSECRRGEIIEERQGQAASRADDGSPRWRGPAPRGRTAIALDLLSHQAGDRAPHHHKGGHQQTEQDRSGHSKRVSSPPAASTPSGSRTSKSISEPARTRRPGTCSGSWLEITARAVSCPFAGKADSESVPSGVRPPRSAPLPRGKKGPRNPEAPPTLRALSNHQDELGALRQPVVRSERIPAGIADSQNEASEFIGRLISSRKSKLHVEEDPRHTGIHALLNLEALLGGVDRYTVR